MKDKLLALKKKFSLIIDKFLTIFLGPLSLKIEKRVSVELTEKEIIICQIDSSKKTVSKIISEKFSFDPKAKFEKDYISYSEKITEILKREKLLGLEANVILPSSETTIKSVSVPLMNEEDLDNQISTTDFWTQFTDLPAEGIEQLLEDISVSYHVISKDKVTEMMEILLVYTPKNNIEILNAIIKSAGLNPTLFEPKCLSIINLAMLSRKVKNTDSFLFLVYGEKENYLFHKDYNKFILIENKVTRGDVILIKQLEKLPDASGPFWDELYDRFLQPIKPTIDEILDNEENKVTEMIIFSQFDQNKNFLTGINKKFENLNIINIATFPNAELKIDKEVKKIINFKDEKLPLSERIKKTVAPKETTYNNFFDTKVIKISKKVKGTVDEIKTQKNIYAFNIGSALRFLNPYNVNETLKCNYRINVSPYSRIIIKNRKNLTGNLFLQYATIILLIIFTANIWFSYPTFVKNKETIASYAKTIQIHDNLYAEIKSLSGTRKAIEKESKVARKILNRKDEYLDFINITPAVVPEGIEVAKVDYLKGSHATFSGIAASDLDVNLFLANLRNNIGKSELTELKTINLNLSDPITTVTQITETAPDGNDEVVGSVEEVSVPNSIEIKEFIIKVNYNDDEKKE